MSASGGETPAGIRITGENWAHQPRGWRDVLRCLGGGHRAAMTAEDGPDHVERCTCGAVSLDGGPWLRSEPFRRVSSAKSARLLAGARELDELLDWTQQTMRRRRDGLPAEPLPPPARPAAERLLRGDDPR